MCTKIFALAIVVLTMLQTGCATGFRASGPRGGGVAVGAGVGQPVVPVVVQESSYIPPLPPPPPPSGAFR